MNKADHKLSKLLVQNVLQRPHAFDWTLQGFGMLRCYLDKETRLHVWDSRFAVPGVSIIHTHPWDFESRVIAGRVTNYRYLRFEDSAPNVPEVKSYTEQSLRCGMGGHTCGQPTPTKLIQCYPEVCIEGMRYSQLAEEIHSSHPDDGSVTLITRQFKEDEEHASVFWPEGESWVSAEPRKATGMEIMSITRMALHRWFVRNPNYPDIPVGQL